MSVRTKVVFLIIAVMLILSFSKVSHADEQKIENCSNTSFTLWTNSSHPGGNKNHKLNEHNGGFGYKCFLEKENPSFVHFDVLKNSHYGDTLSIGYGRQFTLIESGSIKAYVGGALSPTYYEIHDPGKSSRSAFLIIPSVHYGIGYELPNNWGTISFEEKILFGNIRLRSFGWQYKW